MKDLRVVLLISSSQEDRSAVKRVWKDDMKYEILEASNGWEALEILHDRRDVDIIFLDIILSETDGLNFWSRLKQKG